MGMIVLKKEPTFKRTVDFEIPGELDRHRRQSFVAEFRMMSDSQVKELRANGDTSVRAQLDKCLLSVEGVGDEHGNPYSPEDALELVKENPVTSVAALHAYNSAVGKDIIAKNAKAP